MLDADPLFVGAVYIEEDLGSDLQGDSFEITFQGGAPGTELRRLVIDGDQLTNFGNLPGFSAGDVFFDTQQSGKTQDNSGLGADAAFALTLGPILDGDGHIRSDARVRGSVVDGTSLLILDFSGFLAGDTLHFRVDVDEVEVFDPRETDLAVINGGFDPLTSGAEFQGTILTAQFSAPRYHDASVETVFINHYDDRFGRVEQTLGAGRRLNLTTDDENGQRDRTAGALGEIQQLPRPITISGTVFHDRDFDLLQDIDDGEQGIAGVTLSLWSKQNGSYQPATTGDGTPITTRTDADGNYLFGLSLNLPPGTYQVREVQPAEYSISVGAVPGTVEAQPVGLSDGQNLLTEINVPLGDQHAVDYDFAEANPARISGYVYHDRDNDGLFDAGPEEAGIAAVHVRLLDAQGREVASTNTDERGFYEFTGLRAGHYQIVEIQPQQWIDGKDTVGRVDRATGGSLVVGEIDQSDQIGQITLLSADVGSQYNFGERRGSLQGFVHIDSNRNCVFEAQESGIAGVTIVLTDQSGARWVAITDQQGKYVLEDLPGGTYTLRQQQPADFFHGGQNAGSGGGDDSAANVISAIQINAGQVHLVDYNFCEHLGSLSGYVYHDRDNDGLRESDQQEEAIGGVTLHLLDRDGRPVLDAQDKPRIAVTDDAGFYQFTDLSPGQYRLVEDQPSGWIDGKDTPGQVDGRSVGLADAPDQIGQIDFTQPDPNLPAGEGRNYNFGERLGSIEGWVHTDLNGNCIFEDNERGIAGVTITLVHQDGQSRSTVTDQDGRYRFVDLAPGNYTVVETQPTRYFSVGQRVGSGGGDGSQANIISSIVIGSENLHLTEYNFCEALGGLSGYVYHDRDNDGLREPDQGEEAIAGVTVRLSDSEGKAVRDEQGTPLVAQTDATGYYEFAGLGPGTYTLLEQQPAGWIDGKDAPGQVGGQVVGVVAQSDRIEQVVLDSEQTIRFGVNYNFGELLPSSISGIVHADRNTNCEIDEGEARIGGVRIDLVDSQGRLVSRTTTDSQGRYHFDVEAPGVYSVVEHQPQGYFHGGQVAGSAGGNDSQADQIRDIVIGSGDVLVNYNFCELPPARLSGFVFQDGPPILSVDGSVPPDLRAIRDGVRTADDTPLAGVVLQLRDGLTGEAVTSEMALPGVYPPGPIRTVTAADGSYQFVGLHGNRSYAVFEIQPQGFIDGIDTPGTTSGVAINADDELSLLLAQRLQVNPQNDAIILIPLKYGEHSQANNFSEIRISTPLATFNPPPRRVPPPPPQPTLPPLAPPSLPPAVPTPQPKLPLIVGGSNVDYTWHLSVIDAGSPRGDQQPAEVAPHTLPAATTLDQVAWMNHNLAEGAWFIPADNGHRSDLHVDERGDRHFIFGLEDGIPVSGDFDGDGFTEIGVFYQGQWFVDLNGNGRWDEADLWIQLGDANDQPVIGDWDGDGKDDIGIFGPIWVGDLRAIEAEPGLPDSANTPKDKPKNVPPGLHEATDGKRVLKRTAEGIPRVDLIDHVFHYGSGEDTPIAGDWNGDGIDTIGIFRDGRWQFDSNGDGRWSDADATAIFGRPGDLPLVGDFDGDGVDEIGVFRGGQWLLDVNHNRELDAHDRVFEMGGADDLPIVGDFDGDGIEEAGVYRSGAPTGSMRDFRADANVGPEGKVR